MEDITSKPNETKKEALTIYKYDADLAMAFQKDCEELLDKFNALKSPKFEQFASVWRDLKFISIFEGQEYFNMLEIFLQNCYIVVKKFFDTDDKLVQLGALYLLYSLYYKQPVKGWIKVRLTKDEMIKIQSIVNHYKSINNLEPLFIFTKMKVENAFLYVATPLPLGPHDQYAKRYDLTKGELFKSSKFDKLITELENYMNDDGEILQEVDNKYQRLMAKFREKCPELGESTPTMIPENMRNIHNELVTVQKISEADETPSTSLQTVKKKAMRKKNAVYRGAKKKITAIDLNKSPKNSENEDGDL